VKVVVLEVEETITPKPIETQILKVEQTPVKTINPTHQVKEIKALELVVVISTPTIKPTPIVTPSPEPMKLHDDINFKTLDLTTPSNLTIEQLEFALNSVPNNKLVGLGEFYIQAEKEFGINALFLVSLSALESGWGRSGLAIYKNNLFGFNANDRNPYGDAKRFESKEKCILYVAEYIKEHYLTEGGKYHSGFTLKDVNKRYASSSTWDDKIASIMNRFHGTINNQ